MFNFLANKIRSFIDRLKYRLTQMLAEAFSLYSKPKIFGKKLSIMRIYLEIDKIIRLRGISYIIRRGLRKLFVYCFKLFILLLRFFGVRSFTNRVVRFRIVQEQYQEWQKKNENYNREAVMLEIGDMNYKPLVSIIMPVYDVEPAFLAAAIESVLSQTYPYWELCIAEDFSKRSGPRKMIEKYASDDARIRFVFHKTNMGISRATNSAIALAKGVFIGLLDNDDVLSSYALYEVVKLLQKDQETDMIFSDEDKLDEEENRTEPYFKPDWSPDMFLSNMYTSHFGVYRKKIAEQIGGFRPGFEGSQDYDFVLRFTEKTKRIRHIPKILYHWRKAAGSTAVAISAKSSVYDTSIRALSEAMQRRGEAAEVERGLNPISFRVKRKIITDGRISILIPTKDKSEVLERCVSSILEKTGYDNYEIIIIDNGSSEQKTADYFLKIGKAGNIRIIKVDGEFNFSYLNNIAVKETRTGYLLFLNNDTEVLTPGWLSAMVEHIQRKEVGAVGAKLLYPDGRIQHAGVILGIGGVAGHPHKYLEPGDFGYFGRPDMIQNLSAVTAACLLTRREVFDEVGGFDEKNLGHAFNDVDFCLKIREKGYLIAYTPYAQLHHHESLSRGFSLNPAEVHYMRNTWGPVLDKDPYYNPNLSLIHEDFSIKI